MLIENKGKKVLISALLTMLNEQQEFNAEAQRALVRWQLDKGVNGFFIGGSTGEGPCLSTEIRRQLIKTVVDEVNGQVPVIAYIGYADTQQSIDLARFAQSAGVDAISAVPPYYYGYGFEAILGFYRDIAQSVSIPMIVYYIQSARPMTTDELSRLLSLDNVAGLKFTSPDHYAMQQAKLVAGEKLVFSGRDEQCLSGLMMDADGLIGSTYNLLPEVYLRIVEAYEQGDMHAAQVRMRAATIAIGELLKDDLYNPALKALLSLVGIDAPTMRAPKHALTEEAFTDIRTRLAALKGMPELRVSEIIQKA